MFTPREVIEAKSFPVSFAKKLNVVETDSARVQNKAGKTAGGTIDLVDKVRVVYAVLAYTSATGAPATKALLAPTTDYTFNGNVLTCVTDQSANKLVIFYAV